MSTLLKVLIFSCGMFLSIQISLAAEPVEFTSSQLQTWHQLLEETRCTTCPNQTIKDSNAPAAEKIKADIKTLIKKEVPYQDIRQQLLDNYGPQISYQPVVSRLTLGLWLVPLALIVSGVIWIIAEVRRES